MRHEDKPRPRTITDSPHLETLRPADRHARRLGVLGHVEHRRDRFIRLDQQPGKPGEHDCAVIMASAQHIEATPRQKSVVASPTSVLTVAA